MQGVGRALPEDRFLAVALQGLVQWQFLFYVLPRPVIIFNRDGSFLLYFQLWQQQIHFQDSPRSVLSLAPTVRKVLLTVLGGTDFRLDEQLTEGLAAEMGEAFKTKNFVVELVQRYPTGHR